MTLETSWEKKSLEFGKCVKNFDTGWVVLTEHVFPPSAGVTSFSGERETLVGQANGAHVVPQYERLVHDYQCHVVVECTAVVFFVFYDFRGIVVLEREEFVLGLRVPLARTYDHFIRIFTIEKK